jgi:hypothetical protein
MSVMMIFMVSINPSTFSISSSCKAYIPRSWREKRKEICIELIFYLTPPTSLLLAFNLNVGEFKVSGGEFKVSGGEFKVSRRVGRPRRASLVCVTESGLGMLQLDELIFAVVGAGILVVAPNSGR